MVGPVGGPQEAFYGSQASKTGNLSGQEENYIQLLEAYLQVAEEKGYISPAEKDKLQEELSNIKLGSPDSVSQLNNVISKLDENPAMHFPTFAENDSIGLGSALTNFLGLAGISWMPPEMQPGETLQQWVNQVNQSLDGLNKVLKSEGWPQLPKFDPNYWP